MSVEGVREQGAQEKVTNFGETARIWGDEKCVQRFGEKKLKKRLTTLLRARFRLR
jgi:hypothetical protein